MKIKPILGRGFENAGKADSGLGGNAGMAVYDMWWAIAASQGDETARKNRDIAEKKMSPADVSKARKLAREWKKKQKK